MDMKYLLLTYLDEKAWLALSDAERARLMAECEPHVKSLLGSKRFLGGAPLHPTSTATCVRVRGGKRMVTDGPFAETKEQLGGYALIEAKDLDEAIGIAAGFFGTTSVDSLSTIEVRPVMEIALPAHP